ncbi:hypothetical protein Tco_1402317 [Tanacetum coccineum]
MKSKSFEEIQMLYEREQKWINDFVPIDSKVVKDSRKDDAKKEVLRAYLDIILGDAETINVESLATKYPIVDWKEHALSEDKMGGLLGIRGFYDLMLLVKVCSAAED